MNTLSSPLPENAVTHWFGPRFHELHPLLQDLHRHGGRLHGPVHIEFGLGPAGWVGRRLARSLGIPVDLPVCRMEVDVHHNDRALYWSRRFATGSTMNSVFVPVGTIEHGYWIEASGPVELRLTVDVAQGGWYWRCIGVRVNGLPLPLMLFPQTFTGKRIENGRYRFSVELRLWPLGRLLRYSGLLTAERAAQTSGTDS